MRGPEQECEVQTDSLQGPNHTTSQGLFFENSEWESSCQRFDDRGLPWLPCLERFGPNMARKDLKVAQRALHSCCDACLRGDYAWIGPVLHNCGASEPASDADPRQNARETTRNDEKRKEATGRQEGPNDLGWAAGHAICRKGTSLQRLTCELAPTQNPCT